VNHFFKWFKTIWFVQDICMWQKAATSYKARLYSNISSLHV